MALTARESIQSINVKIQNLLGNLTPMMQEIQNSVPALDNALKEIQQLDTQVASIEQAYGIAKQQISTMEQNKTVASELLPGVVKKSYYDTLKEIHAKKTKHLTPRDSDNNGELPDFWRRNYDYGESPYMNFDKNYRQPSTQKEKK